MGPGIRRGAHERRCFVNSGGDEMKYTIVGVIGHIDHGKTSLVAALTGTDTDTHPEEKRRGITIDLGFASFTEQDHQFALIDAPGHQKYIGNLLAGVSSIDVGLLVVACDQGIQAQTLEHASILETLGVERLIVALSRTDLATSEMQDELREELDVFLDDFGFADTPMIPVSSVRQTGIDELKAELCRAAEDTGGRRVGTLFRMPVDRVFTIAGRGAVMAGTVWSGSVRTGDTLELHSNGSVTPVRIRDVEVHGETVESSSAGFRTALNVAGVSAKDAARGDELIQPQAFVPTRHLLAEVSVFSQVPEIKCPATMQLHVAAASRSARLTGTRRLQPGQSTVIVIETDAPVIAAFGQHCLLRLPYPVGTVAGGKILAALGSEIRRSKKLIEFGEKIALANDVERLVAWVDFLGEVTPTPEWCETTVGLSETTREDTMGRAIDTGRIFHLDGESRLVSRSTHDLIQRNLTAVLGRQAEVEQDAWSVEDSVIRQVECFGSQSLIRSALESLIQDGKLVRVGRMVALATDDNTLSKKQLARMQQIVALFRDQRTPPSLKEVAVQLDQPVDKVRSLARFAVQTGMLLDTGNDLLLSAAVFDELCGELREQFQEKPELSVAEIRDTWQVTRKHAVPFLEYCDRNGITTRHENVRTAGPALLQSDQPTAD